MYEDVPDEDAKPISQAEEIRNLRAEIRELRGRIDARHDGTYSFQATAHLPVGLDAELIADACM